MIENFMDMFFSPSIQLASDAVHIWYASVEQSHDRMAEFYPLLSPDEKARAERFYFERDRDRYITGRGLLRVLLAGYLDMEPSRIQFEYGPCRKPKLTTIIDDNRLEFNLSHSNDLVVYSFCRNRRVGIDVEHIHPMADEQRLAEEFFSTPESAYLRSLSGDLKLKAFFKLWTCKEAFVKASGDGLAKPMDQFEIQLVDGDHAQLVSLESNQGQHTHWRLQTFEPIPGYQAALAFEAEDSNIAREVELKVTMQGNVRIVYNS